jgi:anti-anti-sigma regulatory factor
VPSPEQLTKPLGSAGGHREVLVDLAQCDFVDSAAIEAILQAERLLALEGRRIAVVGARSRRQRINVYVDVGRVLTG